MIKLIIVLILLMSLFLISYQKVFYNRKYIVSNIDNKRYLVHDSSSKQEISSANMIAKLSQLKKKLCNYLESNDKYKKNPSVQRLLYNSDVEIEEKSFEYCPRRILR